MLFIILLWKCFGVVMDQQWVPRTKVFLKWNYILQRYGEENTQGLLTLNDILKWNTAWKILFRLLKRRVKGSIVGLKGHTVCGPSREEYEGLKFTLKNHSSKEVWEWLETFSLKSSRETERKEWFCKGLFAIILFAKIFICKGFFLNIYHPTLYV